MKLRKISESPDFDPKLAVQFDIVVVFDKIAELTHEHPNLAFLRLESFAPAAEDEL